MSTVACTDHNRRTVNAMAAGMPAPSAARLKCGEKGCRSKIVEDGVKEHEDEATQDRTRDVWVHIPGVL